MAGEGEEVEERRGRGEAEEVARTEPETLRIRKLNGSGLFVPVEMCVVSISIFGRIRGFVEGDCSLIISEVYLRLFDLTIVVRVNYFRMT